MDVPLVIAGALCMLLALGHATLGIRWVLPGVDPEHLSTSPFGGRGMSASTIQASWHIVTVFAVCSGATLLWLGLDTAADPRTVVLRVFAVMWFGIALVASWAGLKRATRIRDVMRLPVPILFVVVAILCWVAST